MPIFKLSFAATFVLLLSGLNAYSQCGQYGYGTSVNCLTTGSCGSWYVYCVTAPCQVNGRQLRCCPILTSTAQCLPLGCMVAWLANICTSCPTCGFAASPSAASIPTNLNVPPFTMELWTYDANGVLIQERKIARQSDGTSVEIFSYTQQPQTGQARLVSEPGGRVTSLFDRLDFKMSGYRSKEETAARAYYMTDHGTKCMDQGETLQRTESVLGLQAYVIERRDSTSGKVRLDWRVPDLGCETVKVVGTQPDSNGKQRPWVTVVPKFVDTSEPDPALFLQPAGYAEVKPSQLINELNKLRGQATPQCATCPNPPAIDSKKLQAWDDSYAARQVQH